MAGLRCVCAVAPPGGCRLCTNKHNRAVEEQRRASTRPADGTKRRTVPSGVSLSPAGIAGRDRAGSRSRDNPVVYSFLSQGSDSSTNGEATSGMVAGNVHGLLDMRPPFFSYTSPNAPPPIHGSRAVFDLSGSMDLGAGLPPVVPVVAAAPAMVAPPVGTAAPAMVAPPVGTNASPVQYLAPPQHQQQHQQHQRSPVTYVYPPLGSFYHHPPMGHPALRRGPVMVRRGPIFLGRRGYW